MNDFPGTQGYQDQAPTLLVEYERFRFEDSFAVFLDHIGPPPLRIIDIGAGTGRDAAWFATRGDHVTAVEPTPAMLAGARRLHADKHIEWIADGLPALQCVSDRAESYDIAWLSAVWMHLDKDEREQAMPVACSLLKPGGQLFMTLRHGPEPRGRRMFPVSGEETIALAARMGMQPVSNIHTRSVQDENRRAGVTWTALILEKI